MRVYIEKMVYGGAGMARTDKGVLFVEKVLPGEQVEVRIVEQKKDYARGRLSSILEPSAYRREPLCPNSTTVGCCDWGHIAYSHQVDLKEAIVRESLRRGGRIAWDQPIDRITGPERNYRLRASFRVAEDRLGFVAKETNSVVPIRECAALMQPLNDFLPLASEALHRPEMAQTEIVRAVVSPESGQVAARFERGREWVRWPEHDVLTRVEGLQFRLRPESFFQPNQFLRDRLMLEVVGLSGSQGVILDLFCGSGFFSLPLARVATRVIGVDRRSIANAQWNAHRNGISNAEFVKASAGGFLRRLRVKPTAVVLDPPRTGAGKGIIRSVASLAPERVVYVSCNPTTFAPDARLLLEGGYKLSCLKFLDQFPNTHHIELLSLFEKAQ